MELSTKDLTITTPSVTINAIKINNKQMTLAVFRQLDSKDMVDSDFNIGCGVTIWGRVTYSIKENPKRYPGHRDAKYSNKNWIVFEKEETIYKDSIERILYRYRSSYVSVGIEYVKHSINSYSHLQTDKGNNLLKLLNDYSSLIHLFIAV